MFAWPHGSLAVWQSGSLASMLPGHMAAHFAAIRRRPQAAGRSVPEHGAAAADAAGAECR